MHLLNELNLILRDYIFFAVLVNFVTFIFLLFFNYRLLAQFLRKISCLTWAALTAIILLALFIRFFIPVLHHVMYIDEPWYMEAAGNMLHTGFPGEYYKSIGWPFLILIVFGIFGINNWVALYTSLFFGALTAFPLFLLTLAMTNRRMLALMTALIFSLLPFHVFWSATAETNVISVFFTVLSMWLAVLYYRKPSGRGLWLALAALSFTAQIRPENYIFFPIFFLGCVVYRLKVHEKKYFFILPVLFAAIISFPNLIQVLHFTASLNIIENISDNPKWGFENLIRNTAVVGPELFRSLPLIILVSAFLGLWMFFKKDRRGTVWLLAWFAALWFSYFSSFLEILGGRSRVFLSFYPILSIFSAYGIYFIIDKINYLIPDKDFKLVFKFLAINAVFWVLFFGLKDRMPPPDAYKILETRIPEFIKRDLPSECVIIAGEPAVVRGSTDFKAIRTQEVLEASRPEEFFAEHKCLLFFEDYYCFRGHQKAMEECSVFKKKFSLEPFKVYSGDSGSGRVEYTFYKLKN